MSELEPDIDGLSRFINALFTYAREEEFVSLRAFYDDERAKKIGEPAYKIRNVRLNGGGLDPQAAQQPVERLLVASCSFQRVKSPMWQVGSGLPREGGPSAFVAMALGAPSLLGNRIKSHNPAADYRDQGKQCRD